jgi:regulator of protease activity HflC (stomatin/prohibitin superfamily)
VRASQCAYGSAATRCPARLVELVDTIVCETMGRKAVRVRIPCRVPDESRREDVDLSEVDQYPSGVSQTMATEGAGKFARPSVLRIVPHEFDGNARQSVEYRKFDAASQSVTYIQPSQQMTPFLPIAVALVLLALSGLRIAQEYQRGVVFRLGRFTGLRGPGLFWIIPLGIERAVIVDIRTRTVSAEQQETITRDSVTIRVNAVLWYRIVDAGKSVIAVSEAASAVYQLALTGLRNIIGQHDLDEVLQERDKINDLLRRSIEDSTAQWGIEVERFEMKDVELPEAMQQVMAMQAEAIREKRARIIKAEAELEASEKLAAASRMMAGDPAALELRRMQMISEVGADNNSTVVLMIPSDFVTLATSLSDYLRQRSPKKD